MGYRFGMNRYGAHRYSQRTGGWDRIICGPRHPVASLWTRVLGTCAALLVFVPIAAHTVFEGLWRRWL